VPEREGRERERERERGIGKWIKLHNEELHNSQYAACIIEATKGVDALDMQHNH
jgi:hypothetical protein